VYADCLSINYSILNSFIFLFHIIFVCLFSNLLINQFVKSETILILSF